MFELSPRFERVLRKVFIEPARGSTRRLRDGAELTSLVGGPRRAHVFARDLDTWRATLPFGVEVSTASSIKIYRRVTVG